MKSIFVPGTLTLGLMAMFLPALAQSETNFRDYVAASETLQAQQARVYDLAEQNGRYHQSLVEPLQQLALSQLEVSRYDDAAKTADYAIQITRSTFGLDTPQQYDLQQMAIEVDLLRQDWKTINTRLDYYSGLVLSNYVGSVPDRIARLLWLADIHVRGGIEDSSDNHAAHMREATWLNETAVSYAEKHGLGNSRLHAEMLYALTQKYYLEARAISDGGATSYRIRQIHPQIPAVTDKFDALHERHAKGLATLYKMRDMFANVSGFGPEAAAMAELYIADWNALFNESDDINAEYQRAIAAMHDAGVPAERISRFLASPVAIPGTRLELRVSSALKPGTSTTRIGETDEPVFRISLIEPAAHLAGFTQELALVDWQGGLIEDWSRLSVRMTLDPDKQVKVRNGAFRTKSKVTGTDVELLESEADSALSKQALRRIKTLAFRPAFVEEQAVASNVIVDYLVRNSAQRSVTPLMTDRWSANFPAPGRNASLAATGE